MGAVAEATSFEESLHPVMRDIAKPPPFRLNALLLMVACVFLLVTAGLVVVELPEPYPAVFWDELHPMLYSLQLPVALFLGAFLGPFLGMSTLLLYLALGLFLLPVFAGGGGLTYLVTPGFGYWIGMIAGAVVTGRIINRAYAKNTRSGRSLFLIAAALAGVSLAHILGSIWLAISGLLGWITWPNAQHFWIQLSGAPLAYDIAATLILLGLARALRLALWLVLY